MKTSTCAILKTVIVAQIEKTMSYKHGCERNTNANINRMNVMFLAHKLTKQTRHACKNATYAQVLQQALIKLFSIIKAEEQEESAQGDEKNIVKFARFNLTLVGNVAVYGKDAIKRIATNIDFASVNEILAKNKDVDFCVDFIFADCESTSYYANKITESQVINDYKSLNN